MNNSLETSRIKSFQITLGLLPIPASVRNAIPGFIKNDTPSTGNKGKTRAHFGEEKRKLLLNNIGLALDKNLNNVIDIWEFLLGKEEETGTEIIIRNRCGGLMSETTFRDYVLLKKRESKVRKPSLKDQILDLHRQKISEQEMRSILKCSNEHIHRCLVEAGLKMRAKTTNRIYKHKKAY